MAWQLRRKPNPGPPIAEMRAWKAPAIPKLPGKGSPLSLFDTARGTTEVTRRLRAKDDTDASMYVCGITPYDATHLGHAATMITFDLVNRVWRDAGVQVHYVQNVTDIDDPLLKRAKRDNVDWWGLALRETDRFRRDMSTMRVLPPEHYAGAVAAIPAIVERVTDLLHSGLAYRLDDGTNDVYFDISKAPRFGRESRLSRDQMLSALAERGGGDPERAGKKDPIDPLLWRGAREGEPSWPGGELGPGRPGWHIECAIIAQHFLGDQIDLQGGGSDLSFPHHECSTAHSEAITGAEPFAGHYAHAAMIQLNGEKMSKRKGNLIFVSKLLADGVDPMAIRLALIAGHYRDVRNWTDDLLERATTRLARWHEAAAAASGPSGDELLAEVRARMADDLDTPGALAAIDAWAEAAIAGRGDDKNAPALVGRMVDALLGVKL
jgi:L-cysteine:1D-myo-inositol 2-amino-2-deoxy-alpha-D-glucopyranoside ligase